MQNKSDAQLLGEYAAQHSDPAFAEIVARHTDLVYSAALRQTGSPELAREIAQSVFTDLARKARALADSSKPDASLAGWLNRGTRFATLTLLRGERRRQAHERQFMEHFNPASETAPDWERVAPVLDEAMADLDDADHEAVLLRYFKNQDFHAVGLALGVSDDTAQKRVSRAVERLREFFVKRGVTVGASGLVVVISANAVQAAPVGLAGTLSTAAVLAGTITTATIATKTAITTMNWINAKSVAAIAACALVAGTSTYLVQDRKVNQLRDESRNLVASQSMLTAERDAALSSALARSDEVEQLRKNQNELLRLRGEVTALRQVEREIERVKADRDGLAKKLQQASAEPPAATPEVRLNAVSFKGNSIFTEAELSNILLSKVGESLDREKINRDMSEIQKKYREAGYGNLSVRALELPEAGGKTTVTFVVGEPPAK